MSSIAVKILGAAIAAIAGALGPYWMYGQAVKKTATLERDFTVCQEMLLETRMQLDRAGALIQQQNDRIQLLKAEGSRLQGKVSRASVEVSKLQTANRQVQADLERALIPHDAVGAMEWQLEQLLKLAGETR